MPANHFAILSLLLFLTAAPGPASVKAQPQVTFQFDIESELKNGSFDPDRHELKVRSNNYSFSDSGFLVLKQSDDKSTVYSATARFPRSMIDKEIYYQFVIVSNNRIIKEDFTRYVQIMDNHLKLGVLSFGYFEL